MSLLSGGEYKTETETESWLPVLVSAFLLRLPVSEPDRISPRDKQTFSVVSFTKEIFLFSYVQNMYWYSSHGGGSYTTKTESLLPVSFLTQAPSIRAQRQASRQADQISARQADFSEAKP